MARCLSDLGSLGTAASTGSVTTTSLRATAAALEGATLGLVGTTTAASSAAAASKVGDVALGTTFLNGDSVLADRDGAGLDGGFVSLDVLEVDKSAVLLTVLDYGSSRDT